MSSSDSHSASPHDESLAQFGKAAIVVPLIVGGALIVAVIMLWHAHNKKIRLAEAAQIEMGARQELRSAYVEMRALRPQMALERSDAAQNLIAKLPASLAHDYADLKVAQLLVEAESLFMLDCAKHADTAEDRFDKALNLMTHASGEMWQFGMLGRARARFEQKKFAGALNDLDAVMDRNPSFGSAYYWRSLTRRELGDDDGAEQDEARARALDSWPPLRDFMQASCVWTRDILCKPGQEFWPTIAGQDNLTQFFIPTPEELREAEAK